MQNNLPNSNPSQPDFAQLALYAGQVFKPNTPVDEKDLFSGRTDQIRRVIDVIFQKGQHAIIFGERGVGKTSLANVLSSFVGTTAKLLPARINCDSGDTFQSVWAKIFEEMQIISNKPGLGFNAQGITKHFTIKDFFPTGEVTPTNVRKAILQVSSSFLPLIIIDEFDRLDINVRKMFADLIKGLSDYALDATIVLIGVGGSVQQLIDEHQSVARALVQIQMPRMDSDEIKSIINIGLTKLGMTIAPDVLNQIALLSKGLPHYTHLVGLNASRDALDNKSLNITNENLNRAISKAIEDSQLSIRTAYHKAIKSAYKGNLFAQIILACALAPVNELGEFAAQDLREPLFRITGKKYSIPHYAQHLKEFSIEKRGKILIKSGERRFFRYKFSDPLMQPFIIMQGIIDKKITPQSLI
jgi:Cdc6-like AAA superfamily ATPase